MASHAGKIGLCLVILATLTIASNPTQELKDVLMSRFAGQESLVARVLAPIAAAAKTPEDLKKIEEMAKQTARHF